MTKTTSLTTADKNKLVMKVSGMQRNGRRYSEVFTFDFRPRLVIEKNKLIMEITGGLQSAYFLSLELKITDGIIGEYGLDNIISFRTELYQTVYEIQKNREATLPLFIVIEKVPELGGQVIGRFNGNIPLSGEGGEWPNVLTIEGAFNIKRSGNKR